jgi:hypothetical protein
MTRAPASCTASVSRRFASTDRGSKASSKCRIEPLGCTRWLPATKSAQPPSARRTKYAVSRADSKRSEYCLECAACMRRLATSKVPIRSGVNSLEVDAVISLLLVTAVVRNRAPSSVTRAG